MSAPWAPMVAPPLPLLSDPLWGTCPHGYVAESCFGRNDMHLRELTIEELRQRRDDIAAGRLRP